MSSKKFRIFLSVGIFSIGLAVTGAAQQIVTLNEAIDIALQRSFDVRLQQNTAAVASTDNQYAIGAFLPAINVNASRTWNRRDETAKLADGTEREGTVRANNIAASAQLTWTLFDGTGMFATRKRLAELEELGEVNVKNQMMSTVSSVIVNYYNIVRQKQQINTITESMSINEERVRLADLKLQVGTGSRPELLQARVDLNTQRTSVLQQQLIIAQLKDQLNQQLGMSLPEGFDISDSIPNDLSLSREDLLASIEESNQAVLASKKNIEISNLVLRERKADRYPTINFVSTYNFNRQENQVIVNPFSPLTSRNLGFNYGFNASLPILNGFNTRRQIDQARISIERQQLVYDQQKAIAETGIRMAFSSYDNARQTLLIEEETTALARENVTIALEGFRRGVSTFLELRTAQQSQIDASNRLIAARYNAKLAETELLRLTGRLVN